MSDASVTTGRATAAADAAGGMALEARDLRLCDRDGNALVCGVDLAVAPGEFVGLVGESGSGKTLSVRACLGIVPEGVSVEASRLRLAGEDLLGASPETHRRLLGTQVGFVPQNTMAFLQPAMRVKSQLVDGYLTWHPGVSRREALDRAEGLLAKTGIEDPRRVMGSYPKGLSGGQRQRVNVAMALMGDPRIVVADEPTAALDRIVQGQVMDLLTGLARERGAALLVISHNLSLVRARCERVYVMYAGRCVERGLVSDVLRNPGHPYTRALLGAQPRVGMARDERLVESPGTMPGRGRDALACAFAPRCPLATAVCSEGVPAMVPEGRAASSGRPGAVVHEVACLRAWEGVREGATRGEGVTRGEAAAGVEGAMRVEGATDGGGEAR